MAHFTDRELDIMHVLWKHGPATVAEVRSQLDEDLAYTTVSTVLRTLEAKGHVDYEENGKSLRYFATVTETVARKNALARLVDRVFGGSAELLLTQLVEDRRLSAGEVKRLQSLMRRRAGSKD